MKLWTFLANAASREQRVPDERQQHRLPNRQNESVIAGVTQVIARSQCAYRSMGAALDHAVAGFRS